MRTFLYSALLIIVFSQSGFGQNNDIIGQVRDAIKLGSAKELARFFHSSVEVTLEGNVQTYSKTQAEFVLRDFFRQNPPGEVEVIHKGSSKGGQPFAILQYKSGEVKYRLFMKIRSAGGTQLIDDIRFTKE